jgi:hypothetical protein
MIRYLLAVALLVAASCVPALAGEPVMKADPAYGVRYAQEKVVTLPQDQETPYLTLFGDRNDPKFREMVKWFDTNETLVGIKTQTHWNVIYVDSAMYRERYAVTVPALPCVRLQAVGEDQPVAEYSGVNVPMTADAMAKGLNSTASSAECFRRRHCCPQPQPQPIHVDPPTPPLPPTPPPAPKPHDFTWLLLGVLALVGGALGAAKHFSDVYHGRKV